MSRNFTTDVDTQREYFNATYFNNSGQTQIAKYDTTLLKPFFPNPDQWKLAINRMRVPLSGIPLTKNNIPFQKWQVGIEYVGNGGTPVNLDVEYVPQYNPQFQSVSSFLTAKSNNAYSYYKTTPSGTVLNQNQQISLTVADRPISVGNLSYLYEADLNSKVVNVYTSSKTGFTLLTTINTTNPISTLCIDATNNIYVGETGPSGFFVAIATFNSSAKTWTLNESTNLYTTIEPLLQPVGSCIIGGTIYVADYNSGNIYSWSAVGNPTTTYNYNKQYLPSWMTSLNGNLVVAYDPISVDKQYDDLLAILTNSNDPVYDLTNGETNVAIGSIASQTIIAYPNLPQYSATLGIGTDNNTYSQPAPPLLTQTWNQINNTTPMVGICYDNVNSQVYGLGKDNGLYCLDYNGSTSNTWTNILTNFNTIGATSIDIMPTTGKLMLVDKLGVPQITNSTLTPRTFFCGSTQGAQLVGCQNVNISPSKIVLRPLTLQNASFPNVVSNCVCNDGTFFYCNPPSSTNLVKMDNNLNTVATYPLNEITSQQQFKYVYGRYTGMIYVISQDGNYKIYVYNTSGVYQSTISTQIQYNPIQSDYVSVCEVNSTYPILFVINNTDVANTYLTSYNMSNPASPVQLNTFGIPYPNAITLTYNPNDITNGAGSIYVLLNPQGAVNKITFTDNTYSAINTDTNIIPAGSFSNCSDLQYSENLNELYLLDVGAINIYTPTSFTLLGSFIIPNISTIILSISCLSNGNYLSFTPYTSNINLQSLCSSDEYGNTYYATDRGGSVYVGSLTGTAFTFNKMPFTNTYQNISCIGYNTTPPPTTTTQLITLNPALSSVISTSDSGILNLNYLSTTTNNQLAYSSQTDGNVVVGGTTYSSSFQNVYSYVSAPPEQVDGGPYSIFTYQGFLNQINTAFQNSFNNLKQLLGATFLPTQPPSIVYNAQDKLFSLIVEGQYLTTNTDGSNQYNIVMNESLWNQFYFPSTDLQSGSNTYKSILLQNYGTNAVVGTGSASLPQFIYVQQEDSTIYAFYDLVRIIVGTTRIPVSGDGEGRTFSNSGSVSNSAINMITDIVPDTTTLTPGSVIIYIPAGILRWYNLYAQQPFDKIDLSLSYETKDGNIYPIDIINGEFFSVKLEFKKGPGDF